MKKQTKKKYVKNKKNNRKKKHILPQVIITAIIAIAAVFVLFYICVPIFYDAAPIGSHQTDIGGNSGDGSNIATTPIKNSDIAANPIDIGNSLTLTSLAEAAGNFPEDGSDKFLSSILCATFRNDSEQTLQYAKVNLTIEEKIYTFEFSTVPAGKSVRAFEMNRAAAPKSTKGLKGEVEYCAFFDEEPSLYQDQLAITTGNGNIKIQNISGEDINGEFSVFYKNILNDVYMGGITYRLRISGLKAGEEVSGFASHASKNNTEIMFVQYAQ